MNNRIFVTGAAGHIGANFVLEWQKRYPDDEIFALDNFSTGTLMNLKNFKGQLLSCDVRDHDWFSVFKAIKPKYVFHFAANANTMDIDSLSHSSNNVEGLRNILTAAAECNSKVIWTSSAAIYGQRDDLLKETDSLNPDSPYAVSKVLAENLVQKCIENAPDFCIITIRPLNIYGDFLEHKGKMACYIYQMIQQVKDRNKIYLFPDGSQCRDFCHISDLVDLMINAALKLNKSEILNGGSGVATSFNQIVELLRQKMKFKGKVEWTYCAPGHYQQFTCADMSKAKELLGWTPKISIEEGIDLMLKNM